MNHEGARYRVARERTRIEDELRRLVATVQEESPLHQDQTGEGHEAGSEMVLEEVDLALVADLNETLAAVGRAEARIVNGTYGRSIESGLPISHDRLNAMPLAERTVDEQNRYEARVDAGRLRIVTGDAATADPEANR